MKELKSYISEGFFSNVGANNPIKRVIDTIKNASLNDKIKTYDEMIAFADLLEQIFKDIEHDIRNGKFTFEYTTRSKRFGKDEIMISLENSESDDEKWVYSKPLSKYDAWKNSHQIAFTIAGDLYNEITFPVKGSRFLHSIANTIKITKFKVS